MSQVLKYCLYNTCTFNLKILWGALKNYAIVFGPFLSPPVIQYDLLMTPPTLPLKSSQHFWMTFDANSCINDCQRILISPEPNIWVTYD